MPISTRGTDCSADTYSLLSQATTTLTIGDSLPDQLMRNAARRGFTFNVMAVGQSGLGKTTLLSAIFDKNLEFNHTDVGRQGEKGGDQHKDPLNPPISIESKAFEICDRRVRLKLTVVDCKNYGEAICLKGTHLPLVQHIEQQFADYHRREFGTDRRNIQDKMIHCLFFFISALGHGLSKLDLEFLKAAHSRVNVVPIIAKAEALTQSERVAFKRRVKDDLEKNHIKVYEMPDPDPDDDDDMKRVIKEIQDASPYAICSISQHSGSIELERPMSWGKIELHNPYHTDFLLLKRMVHMQMADLCETTRDIFYEEYRLNRVKSSQ